MALDLTKLSDAELAAIASGDMSSLSDATLTLLSKQNTEIPAERRPPPTMAVVTSAPYKAIGGAADVLLNAPQNVVNLAKMGAGTLATAAGYPNLAPEVTAPPERVTNMLRSAGLIKPTENMTPAQKVWDVALQSATGGMLSPARTGAELVRSGGLGFISGKALLKLQVALPPVF